jgi:plastocyanin
MNLKQRLERLAWPAYLTLLICVASGTFIVEASAHAHHHTSEAVTTLAAQKCDSVGPTIPVEILASGFAPATITAKRCDTVQFKNSTAKDIIVAFGPHEQHIAYPGLSDSLLRPGSSTSVLVSVPGNYPVHDHIGDVLTGTLIVSK